MIVDDSADLPLILSPHKNVSFEKTSENLMNVRHVNTESAAMNDTITTAVLHEMNDAMFVRLAPAVAVLAFLMAVGVVGNFAICYIFGFKLGSNTQNFLLLSIGVFDLMSCALGIPAEILDMRHYFLFESEELCKIMRFCIAFPTLASIQVLLVIAADRYRKVCRPLYGQIELKHARLAMVAIIIFALVFSVPPLYIYGHRTFSTEMAGVVGRECSVNDKHAGGRYPIVYQGTLAGCFVISTVALSIIYLKIWLETRRHRKYLKAHTMPGDCRQDNSSLTSEDGCVNTASGSRASISTRESAVWRHVSKFSSFGRRSQAGVDGNNDGHAQWQDSPDLTSATALNFMSPQEHSLSSTSLSGDLTETKNDTMASPSGQVNDELHVDAEAYGLLPYSENNHNSQAVDESCRSIAADLSLRNDIQIIEDTNTDSGGAMCIKDDELHEFSCNRSSSVVTDSSRYTCNDIEIVLDDNTVTKTFEEKQSQADKRRSLPPFKFAAQAFEVGNRRNCRSEDLNKRLLREPFSIKTSEQSDKDLLTQPNTEENAVPPVFFVENVRKENFSSDDVATDDERVSFLHGNVTNRLSGRNSKTPGSVRYDRLLKSQSQGDLTPRGSGSSLASQLSTPNLDDSSLERRLVSPRPKSTLGRMVVSKNMKRIKSNPLFVQASINHLHKSRSIQSRNSEPVQGRFRSQSDPPARLYSSRYNQSQLFSPLNKSKSRSNQSLAVRRVKKAFRATRTTMIACSITTAFILSYLPHLSLAILRSVWISFEHQLDGVSLVLYNIFLRSYFANTAINIFVYGTMNREFREEVNKIWTNVKQACSSRKPI
ncbi:cholecystokinin receptor [Elysia marginata]|uniref:Cholecystokinin receptor n=1 Tax=Elysia marginata TaxID=1093978 RepID=A0AAV4FV21_9GAST|nr:cholecystokinin receptor [Elysia marginata]